MIWNPPSSISITAAKKIQPTQPEWASGYPASGDCALVCEVFVMSRLPDLASRWPVRPSRSRLLVRAASPSPVAATSSRSEEHTSELQSRQYLVCRLLLEKKKTHYPLPGGAVADMSA